MPGALGRHLAHAFDGRLPEPSASTRSLQTIRTINATGVMSAR